MATFLVTGAAIASLGGCGGDNAPIQTISTTGSDSTAAPALSQEDFISSADSRCAEANAAIGSLGSSTDPSTAVGQQLSITQEVLTGIQSLGAPADSSGDLAAFLGGLKSQVSVLKQQQTALTNGDTAAYDALTAQLDQAESETQAAASSYGFDACGQPPSAVTPSGGTTTVPSVTPAPAVTTSTTPVVPAEPIPEPIPASPTGGTGAGTPTPTPTPTPDPGSGGGGGLSP